MALMSVHTCVGICEWPLITHYHIKGLTNIKALYGDLPECSSTLCSDQVGWCRAISCNPFTGAQVAKEYPPVNSFMEQIKLICFQ